MRLDEIAIKLSGFKNTDTKPFMDDFNKATKRSPIGKGRLYRDVLIDASPFSGEIHVSDIRVAGDKQKGSGTKALNFMKDLADKHNVVLSGTAKAYSDDKAHIQDSDRLIDWYKKHGFTANGDKIKYIPKRKH